MLIDKLAIIGVGLIGGSLARALKKANACRYVSGYGRDQDNLKKALELGIIDHYSDDPAEVIRDADVIVIATPLSTFEGLFQKIADHARKEAVITDVGSAKMSVVAAARSVLGERIRSFIPGHPIAGTEKSGVQASFSELFQDHLVILTPLEENSTQSIDVVSRMWKLCGARIIKLPVEYHDHVLAATSHLPHVLAYALVDSLASMSEQEDIFRFSAGGFRDFTRIASSNPEMWSDICVANHENLLEVIEQFKIHLDEIARMIKKQDKQGLQKLFNKVKDTRDQVMVSNKSNSAENNSE